jgi:hypothetical protein
MRKDEDEIRHPNLESERRGVKKNGDKDGRWKGNKI